MKQASCRDRLEQALARIADPKGEGARACLTVYADAARAAADAADARAARGASLGPFDGTIVSIKDLFDVAGEPTRAGSKILAEEAAPAKADATVVQRLRAAGAVIIAKTNMTEFAFSGIGANPHFGTPGNPADRSRVPGGSSAGAPISVADGMCDIAIGTDTGGSVRIPASLCGLVGFKPSRQRVPTDGAFPLSTTLDSVGPIGKSVADCAAADAVMAGEEILPLEPIALAGLRFGVAEGLPLDRLDDTGRRRVRLGGQTARRRRRARQPRNVGAVRRYGRGQRQRRHLALRGLRNSSRPDEPARRRHRSQRPGPHRARLCDIRPRITPTWCESASRLVHAMDARLATLDALLMPTTSIVAPTIAEVADSKIFAARNAAVLRNTAIINFFDLCAISLPLQAALPVGLMLVARNGHDHRLLRIAAATAQLFGA